ncbi:MAG: DUF4476 domain-containing protein [Crocinitomicaceae bacterium]|nr:DUF4476 domain-containing protein [Crocinitomicaceae bacterium]
MKQLLPILTLFIGLTSFSQGMGDLTIFSNTGDKFYVVLNGIRQNQQAETNVKVTGLNNNYYSCKIVSANNNFTIDKNLIVKYDTLITYQIVGKKGKYKMRFYSETPTGSATAQTDQTVVTYHATETVDPITNNTTTTVNTNNGGNMNTNVSTNNTTTTTTTTTSSTNTTATSNGMGTSTTINEGNNGTSETVNMNVSIGENGMNVNISATGMEGGNMSTTTSTTGMDTGNMSTNTTTSGMNTTSTTSTTSTSDGSYYEESTTTTSTSGDGTYYEETTTTITTSTTTSGGNDNVFYEDQDMTATIEHVDCSCSDADVDALVKQIEAETFSDDQQRVANMAAKNKCMNTAQIKKVAKSFTFSENQLSFLKTAYDNCTDKSNYYQLMDVLTFSTDKEELEKFINSK